MATFPVSDYPGAVDSDIPAPASGDTIGSDWGKGVRNAIIATQTELGANPSGAAADVAARFAALDSDLADVVADVAALPGGDTRVFDAVSYGALVDGSTNDTAAWQAAIDACATAGGGIVTSSKNGVSVISGALQDTGGANSQLTLPKIDVLTGEQITIEIRGAVAPPMDFSVIGGLPLPDNHLVLKSTLTSGSGSILAGVGPSGSAGGFTNLHLRLQDVGFRTIVNPTISGLNLALVACVDLERVVVDAGSYSVAGSAPTSTASVGIKLPAIANGAHSTVRDCGVLGFYTGVQHSEHGHLDDVMVLGCNVALNPVAANHVSRYERVGVYHCPTAIKFTGGTHYLDVAQLAVEHAASGWAVSTYDVDDASNYGKGFIRWQSVLAGVGDHNVFNVNGGANLTTSRVGSAIGSGGGSTTYVYRDRLTAIAANTTLTLGATPIANSPLVRVNGTEKWPTTDYTISGAVITFNSALSISDVVTVYYLSTASSASASALSGGSLSITDDFTGANSGTSLSGRSTTTGSKTWTVHQGTWGIASNRAYDSSNTAATEIATVDAAVADVTVQAKIYANGVGASRYFGVAGRMDSTGANGYLAQINGPSGYIVLTKMVSGTGTAIGATVAYTLVDGDTLALVMSGSTLTIKVNGSTILTRTDSTYNSNTRHGIWTYTDQGRFDDFSITS